ncbi:Cof-type HAD-IIB family hydrolase [[Mycoplasma] testudinis]|uniref:Cof-type HAD-IIB family hydrolase n=1 Tax=[Mycoplasma] testudinis TaxID=33924 RepID=UPI000481DF43|nr:Cof-type HAD-IIB family hydrolase [[Mycoplasma] testudinis]
MPKLFIFDLDGTLINDQKEILPESKVAIKNLSKNNNRVVIASGRNCSILFDYAKQLELNSYLIGSGGASIYDYKNNKYFRAPPIKEEIAVQLVKYAKTWKREVSINDGITNYRYYFGISPKLDIIDPAFFSNGSPNPKYNNFDKEFNMNQYKTARQISLKAEKITIEKYWPIISQKYKTDIDCHISSETYLDISGKNISKLSAVLFIMKKIKVLSDDVYVFGDSQNDIPLFKYFKNSICMDNAHSEIKKIAKKIIGNNNLPSIANFLNSKNF